MYDNTNSGAIFVNKVRKTDRHPHFKGQLNVEGKEFWVSGWEAIVKRDGSRCISLKLTAKDMDAAKKVMKSLDDDVWEKIVANGAPKKDDDIPW